MLMLNADGPANGEMTTDENGNALTYDAWGKLRALDDPATPGTDVTHDHDALGRRIARTDAAGDVRHDYHSARWQVLEERDGNGDTTAQHVWSPIYVDALVLRDRDTSGDGTLDERVWATHDANFNVTALLDDSGVVLERYVYDPYGLATVLDADWTADADGQSDAGWQHLHQGGRLDAATGLHHFRHRDYDATLMRWTRQDPAGYVDGMNFHGYLSSSPVVYNDPMGLESVGDQILEYFLIRLVAGGVTLGIATNIATPTKSAYDSEGEMMTQLKGDINNYYASILSKEELDEECWKEVKISGNGASSTASKTFITTGKFLSTGYWLGSSSRVMADGNLWARKTDLGYEIKYVHVRWTWHDNIDANSVAEQIRNGNADFGNVILEGVLVDLVGDKFLNTDFDVEVDFLDRREGTTEIVK